jgi:hypothetical protein
MEEGGVENDGIVKLVHHFNPHIPLSTLLYYLSQLSENPQEVGQIYL